jgi:diketogulonate reductase-like aldo/keto reductase
VGTSLSIKTTVTLNNGQKMPQLGLGVARIAPGEETEQVLAWAFEDGYRHIDTAKHYGNEASVGKAFRKSGLKRKDVWVTTKLWPTDFHRPRRALEASLGRMGFDYVDLYLIHWPTPVEIPGFDKQLWKSMERLADEGLCKAIGVSNYLIPRLQKTLGFANIPPAVNQVRCSPFHYPKALHEFCQKHGVAFEGYSPLTEGSQLSNPVLMEVARKYRRTTAQVALRWALQKGIIVIPKSQNKERIRQNAHLYDFSLNDEDMQRFDALSGGNLKIRS